MVEVKRNGLVGEEHIAAVLLLVGVSRLLQKPLNAIVKGRSSSGKNYCVNKVLYFFPRDAIRELTSSSALAWNYAGDSFCHRIVYLQERNEASGAVHPARLLISEDKLIRSVTVNEGGRRTIKRYVTRGPIASISTTTKHRLEIDDENRNISLWLDESGEQTRRIVKAAAFEKQPFSKSELKIWRKAHRLLERQTDGRITLPSWLSQVADKVFVGDVRVRRYFPAFIVACRAVALLRTFQKRKSYRNNTVDFVDFAVAAILFESVFVESLHRGSGKALETSAIVQQISEENSGAAVDATQYAREEGISKQQAYTRLRRAEESAAIRRVNKPDSGNRKLFLPAPRPRFLPDPGEIFQSLPEVGNRIKFVHPLSGQWVLYRRTSRKEK